MATEQETEDKDETISSTLTQDFEREKVEREFINLTSHYQQIGESFRNLVEEVPHMRKHQLATHLAGMPILPMVKVTTEEKVSSMYRQQYEIEEPSKIQEEYDPKMHGESPEKKLQSTTNSVGEQSALLLMAVRDCVVKKEVPCRISQKVWLYQGVGCNDPYLEKKEHKKGGKQYQHERKRKISEDSVGSQKSRRE